MPMCEAAITCLQHSLIWAVYTACLQLVADWSLCTTNGHVSEVGYQALPV